MKNSNALHRIAASLFMCASLVLFPWWLTLIGAFLFSLVLAGYWEVILLGLLFDLLYGSSGAFTFAGTLSGIILYTLSRGIHQSVRMRQ